MASASILLSTIQAGMTTGIATPGCSGTPMVRVSDRFVGRWPRSWRVPRVGLVLLELRSGVILPEASTPLRLSGTLFVDLRRRQNVTNGQLTYPRERPTLTVQVGRSTSL